MYQVTPSTGKAGPCIVDTDILAGAGLAPSARAAFGMCAVDSTIYVFGGKDSCGRRNDLSTFDTRTNRWKTACAGSTPMIPATGGAPKESSFAACTPIGGSIMVGPWGRMCVVKGALVRGSGRACRF